MTIDMNHTIEILKRGILEELGEEVELIFQYGSFLKGTAHKYSDLDISYVPQHESTWNSITILLNGVMIDFYPIHWSRLERMANFDDVSSTVLLKNQVLYQRTDEVAKRFEALPKRLNELLQPEARPTMLDKAQNIFINTGYEYYLLRQQATSGRQLASLHHARKILKSVLHCLMVCNQACIDTRKIDQVMALPKLPVGFSQTVDQVTQTTDPGELLSACETLLHTTRDLLLAEQRQVQRREADYPTLFKAAYPEFKGDLQHIILACERQDMLNFNLTSLYHELMFRIAQTLTGITYWSFNSLADYEQDMTVLGFPDLLPYLEAKDYEGLQQQCRIFDQQLQRFLTGHSVPLNVFDTVEELQTFIESRK